MHASFKPMPRWIALDPLAIRRSIGTRAFFVVAFVRNHIIAVEAPSLSRTHLKFLQRNFAHVRRRPASNANSFTGATPPIRCKSQVRAGNEPLPHARIQAMVLHRDVGPWSNTHLDRRSTAKTVRNVRLGGTHPYAFGTGESQAEAKGRHEHCTQRILSQVFQSCEARFDSQARRVRVERSSLRSKTSRTSAPMEAQLEERREAEAHVKRVVKDLEVDLKHLMHMRKGHTLEELQKDAVRGVVRGSVLHSIRDAVERADDSEAYQSAVIEQLRAVEKEESRRMDAVVASAHQELSEVQERILQETVGGVRDKVGDLETESATKRAETFEEIKSLFDLSYSTCKELHETIITRQQELVEQADASTSALRLKAYARLAILLPHFPGFPPSNEASRQTGLGVLAHNSTVGKAENFCSNAATSVASLDAAPDLARQKPQSRRGKWMRRVGMLLLVPIGAFFVTQRRSKTRNRPERKRQPKVSVKDTIPTVASPSPPAPIHPKVTLTEQTDSAQVLRRKKLAQG